MLQHCIPYLIFLFFIWVLIFSVTLDVGNMSKVNLHEGWTISNFVAACTWCHTLYHWSSGITTLCLSLSGCTPWLELLYKVVTNSYVICCLHPWWFWCGVGARSCLVGGQFGWRKFTNPLISIGARSCLVGGQSNWRRFTNPLVLRALLSPV